MKKSRHLLFESTQLAEASFNAETGEAEITIITAGFNASKSRFYPAEVLRRDFRIFENLKMFEDHQTEREAMDRPEGSVRNWVGNVKNPTAETDGTIRATAVIIDEQFRAKLRLLAEKKLLGQMGISIRAIAQGHEEKVDDIPVLMIDALLRGRSVDFVTSPGAGGKVQTYESDPGIDVDLIPAAEILARRPDIVAVYESTQDGKHKMELQAETQVGISKLINESKLPEPAKKRLTERFKDAENKDGVEEAIKAEGDYLAEIAPTRVSGMGGAGEPEVNLAESFQRMGLSEEEAKIAAAGRI